mgnify:CR=1 FL=1
MADLIPFPREWRTTFGPHWQVVANIVHMVAEKQEVRATSEYLNRPCRSPAELEAMLRATADTTAAREGV